MSVKTSKSGLPFLLAVVALSCPPLLPATEKEEKYDQGTVKAELEKLEDDWAAAVETNDPDRIGRFFTKDFLFVGAGGVLQDRQQHLDDFRSGRLKIESVKIERKTVHIYEGAAVVSSRVNVKGKFGTRDISGPYQFTDTWVKQGGRWLAAARQQTQARMTPPKDGER
jgi:ketosteroid isomerase-like protein